MNYAEYINKLEELSHVIQGKPVSLVEMWSIEALVIASVIFVALITGLFIFVPLIAMHLAVMDETKESSGSDNAILWFLAMSIALVFSVLGGAMSYCFGRDFAFTVVNHERELREQRDMYQQTSTDLYNKLVDMSDDEFEKLSTVNSKFELTKEQKAKYSLVTKTIDKVTKNKNK